MLSIDSYLSREFDEARYNCWDMLRDAVLDLTGIDIKHRTPSPPTKLAMRRAFDAQEGEFARIAEASSPCIVLMRRRRAVPHVGLFLRGRVLHIQPGGPRFDRLADAIRGFEEVRFYAIGDADRQSAGARELGAA